MAHLAELTNLTRVLVLVTPWHRFERHFLSCRTCDPLGSGRLCRRGLWLASRCWQKGRWR